MIELVRRIEAPPEIVFAYFTDSLRYTAWMGTEAELDARPGGIYRVRSPKGPYARGEFVEVDAPRRVVFTWGWEGDTDLPPGSSRVEITLTADGENTLLRLKHNGLPDATAAIHNHGWNRYLDRLTLTATGTDPGDDLV